MTTLLSPFDLSRADQQSGRTFRKQILKKGTITYQGQRIAFDDAFCQEAVRAFHSGAYDQVPFVLADMSNRHNMDPDRFRGEVVDMEVTPDGIDAVVKTTKAGAKAIESNPRLGVSARIVQGLEKVDGRRFKLAIQHVLATMDPRLTGMRPWEAVDLAEIDDDEEVLDLTNAHTKKGTPVPTKTARRRSAGGEVLTFDLSQLTDKQFELLLSTAVVEAPPAADDGVVEETVTRKTKRNPRGRRPVRQTVQPDPEDDELDDEDLEDDDELEDEEVVEPEADPEAEEDEDLGEDDEDLEEEEPAPPVAKKKKKGLPVRQRVEMSTPIRRKKVSKARRLELELAEEKWANKKIQLIDAGVPPALLDLAEPIMKQPDRLVIDLSETGDRTVDARMVLGRVLEEVSGMIDLAPEMGHGVTKVSDDKDDETRKKLNVWDDEYGKP